MTTTPLDDLRGIAIELETLGMTEYAARVSEAIRALEPVTLPPPVDVEAVTAELGPAPIYEHLAEEKAEGLS